MSNTGDIRYGNSPFPYGDGYDMGVSIERTVGAAEDPRGLIEGNVYAEITLHKSYAEYAAANPLPGERTIYVNINLFTTTTSPIVTIRLGESFQTSGVGANIVGRVAGLVNGNGLIGLFSWRRANGTLEWFPDSALTVFETVVTPETINGTSWGGENAYTAATTGAPLYYFLWDNAGKKLDGPVRRVLPEVTGDDALPQYIRAYGVFVPLDALGEPLAPIPAIARMTDGLSEGCVGYISPLETEFESESSDAVPVGNAALEDSSVWGPVGGASTSTGAVVGGGGVIFDYTAEFVTAFEDGHAEGYFFNGWYNPALAIDDPLQNQNRMLLSDEAGLSRVYLLDGTLAFTGGTPETPNPLYLILTPVVGSTPSLAATLEFAIGAAPETENGSASAMLAAAFTETDGTVVCYGEFYVSMWVLLRSIKKIRFNTLPDGASAGQLLGWDGSEWSPTAAPTGTIADGSVDGQLMVWDEAAGWIGGPAGATAGQVLKWDGAGWTAGEGVLPTGATKQTLFYDGATGASGWTANPNLLWEKYTGSAGSSTGGDLIIDLSACPTRAWDAPMPGLMMKHPAGGTCGLFANVESGADAGARMDMGWGGANGGNFELYGNSHPTRPGEFRVIYGPSGHIEFKNFRGASDWEVTAGLTKEGRLFCGFNDSGFPGSTDTFGTYPAPAYPFQVFDETSHASKMVSGVTKEGRGFFGLGGAMPTAGVEHPVEIYNESGTPERVVLISKTGRIETRATVSGTTHAARLDCNDVAMSTGATAQAVQLREMVMPFKDGATVKGRLSQVMCGAGYGETMDLGGGTDEKVKGDASDPTAGYLDAKCEMTIVLDGTSKKLRLSGDTASPGNYYAYCTNASGVKGWMQGVTLAL